MPEVTTKMLEGYDARLMAPTTELLQDPKGDCALKLSSPESVSMGEAGLQPLVTYIVPIEGAVRAHLADMLRGGPAAVMGAEVLGAAVAPQPPASAAPQVASCKRCGAKDVSACTLKWPENPPGRTPAERRLVEMRAESGCRLAIAIAERS